jgi:hypothetical protein
VLFVGRAQEKTWVWRTRTRRDALTGKSYAWPVRDTAMVNQFYVYAVDADFGPFFVKSWRTSTSRGRSTSWVRRAIPERTALPGHLVRPWPLRALASAFQDPARRTRRLVVAIAVWARRCVQRRRHPGEQLQPLDEGAKLDHRRLHVVQPVRGVAGLVGHLLPGPQERHDRLADALHVGNAGVDVQHDPDAMVTLRVGGQVDGWGFTRMVTGVRSASVNVADVVVVVRTPFRTRSPPWGGRRTGCGCCPWPVPPMSGAVTGKTSGTPARERSPDLAFPLVRAVCGGGRYWFRTSDLFRVKEALSH